MTRNIAHIYLPRSILRRLPFVARCRASALPSDPYTEPRERLTGDIAEVFGPALTVLFLGGG